VPGGLDVVLRVTLDSISRQLRANVVSGSQQLSNCQHPSMNFRVRVCGKLKPSEAKQYQAAFSG
jgi:hypothetical protein